MSPFDTGANAGVVKWKFPVGADGVALDISPIIGADGTIYFCFGHGLFAINPDGSSKWTFTISGEGDFLTSPVVSADGAVYVGDTVGDFYSVNPDGSQRWRVALEGGVENSAPTIDLSGTIYVESYGNLEAVNPDGTEKWEFPSGGSSPAIGADGTIYVGNPDAISPDGSLKWKFANGGGYGSPAIGADGTLYVPTNGFEFYALNPDGSERWEFASGSAGFSSPGIGADGTIYTGSVAASGLYLDKAQVYALNPDGSRKWEFTTAASTLLYAPAIGADATIYIGDMAGNLYAINPAGSQKWKFTAGSQTVSAPVIGADGTVYFASNDGNLYALGALTMTPVNLKLKVSPSVLDFGALFVGADTHTAQQSAKQMVVVTNPAPKGGPPVTFGNVWTSIPQFAIRSNGCTGVLMPGQSCVVLVTFTPSKVGDFGAQQLNITDNASPIHQVVTLKGKGTPPTLGLGTGTFSLQAPPKALSVDFGSWRDGTRSGDKKVVLTNLNQFVPITIENWTIGPRPHDRTDFSRDFSVDAQTCIGTPLAPGKKCELDVSFSPKSGGGPEDAELNIFDDALGSPQVVQLAGVDIAPTHGSR